MTFAARIKTKTLLKNTVIYRIFAWLGRLFNMMGMNLKAAFLFFGYLLLNAIGAVYLFESRYSGFALAMLAFFNCAVLFGILECVSQMKKLKEAATAIAEGNLSYETDTSKLKWEFKEHGESLNSVGRGMARAVNERMRSERFKTELITNVSHDLKTPLTSIVTYIDLLQKEEIPGEQAKEYVDTIARQSAKLKKLTEDLIEASKASSGVMSVNLERVNVSELLRQSVAEYGDRMTAAGIATVMTLPEEDIYIIADGRLLWRVMDNLLLNICRHGMNGTRAYIGAEKREENTVISFKNISSKELNISPEELLERFVQGDESRNTEGSGLGLSIAQSLTELMKGKMELYLDGDLFKVELIFPKDEMASNTPSYANLMMRLPPSMTSSTSATSLPPPKEILSPGRAFLPGRTSTSHVSMSLRTRSRISMAAPVPTLSPYNLAGSTLVLLMTRQSPARRYSLISLKCRCSLSPLSLWTTIRRLEALSLRGSWAMSSSGRSK